MAEASNAAGPARGFSMLRKRRREVLLRTSSAMYSKKGLSAKLRLAGLYLARGSVAVPTGQVSGGTRVEDAPEDHERRRGEANAR